MIDGRRAVAAAICLATALPAAGQSLADIARQEAARRDLVTLAARSYTNADLMVDPLAAPASAAAAGEAQPVGYLSIRAGRYVSAADVILNSAANYATGKKALEEPSWRSHAETLRGQLLKIQQESAAMSATAADQNRSPGERAMAERVLAQRRGVLADLERRWLKLEMEAETVRIPRAWLEPRPTLSTQTPK